MTMSQWSWRWLPAVLMVFGACGYPVSLEDRPCPCADGWVCCESGQVCVQEGTACPAPACEPTSCAAQARTCGTISDGCGATLDCGACPAELSLRPATSSSRIRGAVAFTSSEPADWSVVEGIAGGIVTTEGLYLAPPVPGTYHVRAQSKLRPTVATTATIVVHDSAAGLELAAGSLGGDGFRDGVAGEARFFYPEGLALDGDQLYVADAQNHAIRQVDLSTGAVSTLLSGPTVVPVPQQLALDGQGHLYVLADTAHVVKVTLATKEARVLVKNSPLSPLTALAFEGDQLFVGSSTVHTIDPETGEMAPLASDSGPVVTDARVGALAGSGDGRLFVADGARIQKVDLANRTKSEVVNGGGAATALVFDRSAETLLFALDSAVSSVSVATGAVETLAGHDTSQGVIDGVGIHARLSLPSGLALGAGGKLFLSDTGNNTVRRLALDTRIVTTIAGLPRPLVVPSEGSGPPVSLEWLEQGATVVDTPRAGINNLYFADGTFIRVVRAEPATDPEFWRMGLAAQWVAGSKNGTGYEGELGRSVSFNQLTALTMAPDRRLFALDARSVRMVDLRSSFNPVTLITGDPATAGHIDGPRSAARLDAHGMAWIGEERLLLTSAPNETLRMVAVANGEVTTVAGADAQAGCVDGQGAAARFRSPYGIAWTGGSIAYVADACGIREVDIDSWEVRTLVKISNGLDTRGARLAIDPTGRILVVTRWAPVVRRFDPNTLQVEEIIGSTVGRGIVLGDPPGGLNEPTGIAVTPGGMILILDEVERAVLRANGL